MSNLGVYILDQIRCIYPNLKNTPVILNITDLKNRIQIKFNIEGNEQVLTFNDMYLADINSNLKNTLDKARNIFIKVLGSEIKEGFKSSLLTYDYDDYPDMIRFNVPLVPEVIEDIRNTANDIFKDKAHWGRKLTPNYISSLGSPLFSYHLCKCLILILQEYKKKYTDYIIPQDLLTALEYPNQFFNPKVSMDNYNESIDRPNLLEQLDGDIN